MEARSQLRHRPTWLRTAVAVFQFSLSFVAASNSTRVLYEVIEVIVPVAAPSRPQSIADALDDYRPPQLG
jgi:hypothetical protein